MASLDNEQTPLLGGKSKTPLPWGQISLGFVSLVAEPISSVYILPFINQVGQHLFLYVQHLTLSDGWSISIYKSSSASWASREETIARLVIMQVSS